MLLAGLSTGHMIGLVVVAAIFVTFALLSSFVAPRRWPDFPGEHGLPVFVIASIALFVAMISAVLVFGVEEPKAGEGGAETAGGGEVHKAIPVTETEFKIALPATGTLQPGQYEFDVKNAGKIGHDLAIEGGGISEAQKTPTIDAGGTAKLTVTLDQGTYTLYCSIPGHREAGMVAKISVG